MALLTPALIGVSLIFKTGGIRAGVKGAGVKKGPAEKGPIRYIRGGLTFGILRYLSQSQIFTTRPVQFLPVQNVFSTDLVLCALYFKFKFVSGGAVPFWEF